MPKPTREQRLRRIARLSIRLKLKGEQGDARYNQMDTQHLLHYLRERKTSKGKKTKRITKVDRLQNPIPKFERFEKQRILYTRETKRTLLHDFVINWIEHYKEEIGRPCTIKDIERGIHFFGIRSNLRSSRYRLAKYLLEILWENRKYVNTLLHQLQ